MNTAVRAIIIENDKLLVIHRNKQGNEYYTLVGGKVSDSDENLEKALAREVKEETGLVITESTPVFIEEHPEPYNEQYIYLCKVAPHQNVALEDTSEEAMLNTIGIDLHTPCWIGIDAFSKIAFRTPQLQEAITKSIKNGFPSQPIKL